MTENRNESWIVKFPSGLLLFFSSNYCNPQNKGKCNRCQMVCIDQETGVRSVEPLKTLGKIRGSKVCVGKKNYLTRIRCAEFPPPLQPPIFIQHFICFTCNHSANFNDSPCNSRNLTPYGLITITDTLAVSMISSQKVSKDDFRSRAKSWR